MISSEAQQRKSLNNYNKQCKAFWFFLILHFCESNSSGHLHQMEDMCRVPIQTHLTQVSKSIFSKTMYWVYIHVGVHKRHPRICIYVEDKGFFASPFWALARALSSLESSWKLAWSVGSKDLEIGFWIAIVGSFLHQMSLVIYCWKAPVQIHFSGIRHASYFKEMDAHKALNFALSICSHPHKCICRLICRTRDPLSKWLST